MSRKNVEDIYPLSPLQQGILFHAIAASDTGAYFLQHHWVIEGPLDAGALQRAFQGVVDRHPALRTAFVWDRRDRPMQVVRERVALPFEVIDWRGVSEEEQARQVSAFAAADRARGFEPARAPLMRVSLLRLADDRHRVLWSVHHLLLDGWSTPIVVREVFALHDAGARGEPAPRLPRPRPYGDYIGWLQTAEASRRSEAFFRAQLAGLRAPTPLGVDHAPQDLVPGEDAFDDRRRALPEAFAERLAAFARQHQITVSTLMQGAWALVLARYAGEEDVLFGLTVSGRSAPLPGIEGMVGLFINTLPLRARVPADATVGAWLAGLAAQQAELLEHEHTPLLDVQGWSEIPHGTPLFESVLVVENYPVDEALRAGMAGLSLRYERTHDRADLPLTVVASMRRGLLLRVTYDRRCLDDGAVERMLGHLATALEGLVSDPGRRLRDVPLLGDEERRRVVVAWNATRTDYPRDATIHALFAAQAAATPEATALVSGDERITYGALDREARKLAHHLRACGVGPEALVGLYARRSVDMVVATLAILGAGGAYLPLDPDMPDARLTFMLEDAGASVVVAAGASVAGRPTGTAAVVDLAADAARIAGAPGDAPAPVGSGESLAYVMYTSGSTGTPKGVCVVHRGVVRLVKETRYARFGADEVFLQLAPIAFDAATLEIWGPLLNGGTLVLFPPEPPTPARLGEVIAASGVTTLWLTAGLFNAVVDDRPEALGPLRQLLVGGEALSVPHVQKALAALPGVRIINGYGPTEGTTFTCCHPITSAGGARSIPIGRPVANTVVYVLDDRLQPVPVGVPGELYAGGDGLARGYLRRPALDAERFVSDPFSADPRARLYRTGDRVRWLADGTLAFLGRLDHQVKLRGFRIEPGEIEVVLERHPAVRRAVVLAREDVPGDPRLVAYIVPAGDAVGDLRAFLGERLPAYMVPAAFVLLAELPLTANGKVDRRALPAPGALPPGERLRVPPRGPVEEAIAGIFAEALHVDLARVGAHEGFFDLGGHSLLAIAAVGRIRAVFSVDLPLRALFDAPTPAALAVVVHAALSSGASGASGAGAAPPLARAPAGTAPVVSFAQERLWFLAQLAPGDPSYNVPLALHLEGPLDVAALERALTGIVRRHEVLRTALVDVKGRPVAVVHEAAPVPLAVKRLDALPEPDREAAARREAEVEARLPFDLASGRPLRATLLVLGETTHRLLLTLHHVVSDGWSIRVLYRELEALYAASPLPELPLQYADYAAWQRAWLSGDVVARELAFWRARLDGAPRALDLPTDRPRPPVPSHAGARAAFTLPEPVARAVKDLSRREGATPFMTLLAAFDVLLHRFTGQADLLVGTPIAGRTRAETEGLVGFFVNTLVLRADLSGEPSFREALRRVKDACLAAFAHQEMPFEQLVREIEPDRDPSRSPLFQVSFTLQAEPVPPPSLPGLTVRRAGAENTTAKFDLTLALFDGVSATGGMAGVFEYATDLFDAATVARMAGCFVHLVTAAVADPARPVHALPLLSAEDRAAIVTAWNATAAPWPEDATLPELFEAQVARDPDAVALLFQGRALRYAELDRRADQLAHRLAALGVGPESLVGICMDRAPEMIVALLATVKAGGAWVPLDPAYPPERLAFMIEDARLGVILTQQALAAALPAPRARLVCLDAEAATLAGEPTPGPAALVTPESAAYVIYTSGSTGRPKGVVVEHRGLGNVAEVHRRAFGVGPGSRVLQLSSMSFDASVWETVMALLNGATLVLAPRDALLPGPGLHRTLVENAITHLTVPPSVLAALPHADFPALGTIVVAGEACPEELVNRWASPGRRFWNAYGPTETTICATMGECAPGGGKPGIGRPIANVQVYVLDAHREPVPVGVPGEICVGGVGLARGYLRRPEITAARFVESSFAPGERLYRTGDLGRFAADGTLEFLGRIDLQVKLRGFRIELGEIDAVIRQLPAVADAVTVAREGRLVAYVVAADPGPGHDAGVAAGALRAYLKEKLPEHMVPAIFVRLPALPLTPNGKVDRRALPAPEAEARAHVAPRGPVEEAIAAAFAEVLRAGAVGAHDGFFALGGHSLLATQVVARLRAAFGVELPLRAIFEAPTPAELALVVRAAREGDRPAAPPLVRATPSADLPLSFAQERLWFLAQLDPDDVSYVIPTVARLAGRLDTEALRRALDEVVRRHEVLRTTFEARGGKPAAVVREAAPVPLPVTDARGAADPEEAARRETTAELARPFDLARGPLLRARLIRLAEGDHVLVVAVHHIASDGWSQAIFNREIGALYGAFSRGLPTPLADLPLQYGDFAAWQRRWLTDDVLDAERAYWTEALAGAPRALELPADHPRPPVPSHRGGKRPLAFPAELARALEAIGRAEGATLFMTLVAALDVLFHRWSGQRDIVMGTPITHRPHVETEPLIGFFVNNLVLRVRLSPDLTFRALLRAVRAACLGAYAHQQMPFERLVQAIAPERDLGRVPLFQVSFTLQNEPGAPLALDGVEVRPARVESVTAKVDLLVSMTSGPGGLRGAVEYSADLFEPATVDRMIAHLGQLLAGVAADPDRPLHALPLLPEAERRRVVLDWNATAAAYPAGLSVHDLFSVQAARAPSAPALIFEGAATSYAELDARSSRLAAHLRRAGVGPEARVGVALRRGPEAIVALLGVLKAGGAYVPLDPAYPADRLAFMIADAGIRVLVSEERVLGALPVAVDRVIAVDGSGAAIDAESPDAPATPAGPSSAAYVIYTSGSTGRPKGVVVEHRGLGNVAAVQRRAFGVGPGSRVLQFSSSSFDASVWETLMALLNGATLVLAPLPALLPGPDLARTLRENEVSVLTVPPSVLAALPHADLPALHTLVVAGEACSEELVNRWATPPDGAGPARRLWNAYGPTEASICATMGECFPGGGKPSIGRPIGNAQVYVLDARGEPAPIGVPGELCIGGVGLARGYLGRPDLTAQTFVPSPFAENARLYRTGDLARWQADGTLEFLGRIDHQVKLRGFRVELGEIEAVLRQHPGVADAAVIVRADRLVAYVVPSGPEPPGTDDLRASLAGRLPGHMVPATYVTLDAMPLTPSGKVDRAALPAPEARARDATPLAPRSPVEEVIERIWADVLGLDRVGVRESFFALGGHSLLAAQVMARLVAALAVDVPLQALFEAPTVEALARTFDEARRAGQGPALPLARVPRGGEIALSFAQERLWFLDQLEPGDASYVVPLALRLRGALDPGALARALAALVRRHEVLRTTFDAVGGRPVARIHAPAEIALPVEDLAAAPDPEAAARREAAREATLPFDLARGPVLRARLLRLAAEDHVLLLSVHHIAADGASAPVLLRDLGALYDGGPREPPQTPPDHHEGRPSSPLPDLPIQYADHAAWQRGWLSGDVEARQLAYWTARLAGSPRTLDLPADRPHPPSPSHRGASVAFTLPAATRAALEALGRAEGATLFMTLLAAFDVLLHRVTGQRYLVVGAPIAGRARAETEGLAGFFANTLVLRAEIDDDLAFPAFLRRVRETCLAAYAHQDLPFERLVQAIDPARDARRTPLFQVTFTLQAAAPDRDAPLFPGLDARRLSVAGATAKFDLSLAMAEQAGGAPGLAGAFAYATDLFDAATIERLAAHLGVLLEGIAADPHRPLWQLPLLTPEDRARLLAGPVAPAAAPRACLHQLFEAQADRTPDAFALTFEGRSLTYRDLDRRADQVASALRRRGVRGGTLVGLCVARSLEMVVGLLGILKAGGAYLPLDPDYPRERLAFMLTDAAAPVVVTQARVAGVARALPEHGAEILLLDGPEVDAEPAVRAPADTSPDGLAYVLYTSGSTGKPKGVMVTHANVVRLFEATGAWFHFDATDVWTLFHSYAFDFSVWEIWGALLHGGRLVVVPYWVSRSPTAFRALLAAERVTVLNQTPSAFRQLVHADAEAGGAPALDLRYVVFGGEALDVADLRPWWDRHGDARPSLVNMYGITETTVHVTYRPLRRADLDQPWSSVIGVPIPDLRVLVLDAHRRPVPLGVPGEMYVGGAGVARGYLARPDLTAERFVPDPFDDGPAPATLYRTGDLGRRLRSGELEYLGRIDQQVKIRGFRVELGEIEAALEACAGVREAVVVLREDDPGDKRLVTYVVLDAGAGAPGDLRAALRKRLPEHMVPAAFVTIAALPLGPTGKIDRAALPAPDAAAGARADGAFEPPRGPVEEALAGIYADVLKLPEGRVGAGDGFFDLGGHSLLATQVVARAGAAFGVDVPLRALFDAPTVAGLGQVVGEALRAGHGVTAPPLVPAARDGGIALSFAQERLWFLDQLDPGDPSYIVPTALRLQGPLHADALAAALTEIVRRHEVLRTSFAVAGGKPRAVLHDPLPVALPVTRWPALSPADREEAARREVAAESRRPFDLATAPLLRARLLALAEDDHVLSLTVHHIVSDAWSQGVLQRELAALYAGHRDGLPSSLPGLAVQYADFAAWQRRWMEGDVEARQLAYWTAELAGAPPTLDLPTDRPRPPVQSHAGSRRAAVFPLALLASLRALARAEGATLFMTLLAALDVLLHRYTGETDIVVGSPIAGRTRAETEPLLGFFVNTLVLRARVDPDQPFRALLGRTRAACLGAYTHQDMPFERLVGALAQDRALDRTPLFQVLFALQNAGAAGYTLPGLAVRGFGADSDSAKFDLTLVMGEAPTGLTASFEYATALFDASTVDRMLAHLRTLLEGIAARPDAPLHDLPLLPDDERRRLVADYNSPAASYAPAASLPALFEAQADRTPTAPALTFEGQTLTYGDLDARANRVAHALRARGAGPETLVGLCAERSLEMVIALLGILKAGAAYLPLDPEYPKARLAFMLEDSRVPLVLAQASVVSILPASNAAVVPLDGDEIAASPAHRPGAHPAPGALAYVIYTSGSTGKPKGAMVTHHNVVRLFQATEAWFHFDATDVWTLFHSYAFDFSVWEIWGALLHGGRLVVVPYWVSRAPDAFLRLLSAEGVTVLNQTPSAFRQLVHAEGTEPPAPLALRHVVFGGEALDPTDLLPFWDRHGDEKPRLVNMYGITETTVHVTYRPLRRADAEGHAGAAPSLIGRPIPDLQLYVLDPHRSPAPTGVPGEIYVGGAGVSRGYLARPELTAERFLDDPFLPGAGRKLYRTGDLARHLASGDVAYLGRIDHQVKIRGFRIELGEIEAVLEQHPTVREAVVLARADSPGDKRLVAYLVCAEGPRPTAGELRAFTKEKLPDPMIPAAFVLLDALPLTENGKIDRRALPAPEEGARAAPGEAFAAPATAAEEALARIWASVLRLERVGIHDNFFEVGGDSILSIQIVARAQQEGLHLTPRQIFQQPTIAQLAASAGTALRVHADQGPVTGPVPLTPVQRWWLEQDVADPHHWNQSFFLEASDPLDPTALADVLAALLDHHDALRLRLSRPHGAAPSAGAPRQTLAAPGDPVPLTTLDLTPVPAPDRRAHIACAAAEAQASLDLESGPLLRALLFQSPADDPPPSRLLLVVHHLAVDGVSWRILLDDLWTAYAQRLRGAPIALPAKTTSFQRWSERLTAHARAEVVASELPHWQSPVHTRAARLPLDHPGAADPERSARNVTTSLPPDETEQLLRRVPEAYQTRIDDVLLTALAQSLATWTGSRASLVDLEGHGREALFDDLDVTRTVGWFTAIYPLALELPAGGGPGAALKAIKEQIRAVPNRGLGYGLLRYLRAGDAVGDALAALPQAEVSFNYLGQLDQALPGAEEAPFRWARESAGPAHSPGARRRYLLDVTASVSGGRLRVQWTYGEGCYERATIAGVAEGFMEALRGLIAHCLSPEAGGYTPSDFQEKGLSQSVVDMLAGLDDEEEDEG